MAFSTQKNFAAAIDGIKLYDVTKNFDYSKLSLEERKQIVKEMLEGENGKFFIEYFSKYFKAEVGQGDYLSEEVNVCVAVERMADYLLASSEVKEQEKAEAPEYKYYKKRDSFEKAIGKDTNLEAITGEGGASDNTLHFLLSSGKNQKAAKDIVFSKSDLKKENAATTVLKDYSDMVDIVTKEMKSDDKKLSSFKLAEMKGKLKEDMNISKKHLLGIFGENMNPTESTRYDLSLFDISNEKHLLGMNFKDSKGKKHFANGLLSLKPTDDLNNDFNLLLLELQGIIDKTEFTDSELNVLALLRESVAMRSIAEELNITHKKVLCAAKSICRKISKTNNKMKAEELQK